MAIMKSCHAAALALVGWYLMIPPTSLSAVSESEPLSKWTVYQDYDSFQTCIVAKTELHRRGQRDPSVKPSLQFPPEQLQRFLAADCIASDDPRLKGN